MTTPNVTTPNQPKTGKPTNEKPAHKPEAKAPEKTGKMPQAAKPSDPTAAKRKTTDDVKTEPAPAFGHVAAKADQVPPHESTIADVKRTQIKP